MSRTLADVLGGTRCAGLWAGPVIDCDVHARVASLDVLLPYVEPTWRALIQEYAYSGPPGLATVHPPQAPTTTRPEWRTDGAPTAATSVELLQSQALDAWTARGAVLHCYYGLDSVRHPDLAVVLARAINDWLIAEWLDRDPRLKAAMVVPPYVVADMVAEIERVGGHPGFVEVAMPVRSASPYGHRNWYPLFEALQRQDLILGLGWGGTSSAAPTPTGWPSWFLEEYAGEVQVFMSQLISLVGEGTFQRFPQQKVVVYDIGFAWVPSLIWRLEKEWKGLRRTVPWIDRPIGQILRDHVRFSSAPLDAGPPAELARIVRWLGDEMVMFASDYPHHHDDDIADLLEAIPAASRARIMHDNAAAFYGFGAEPGAEAGTGPVGEGDAGAAS
ncbi:MAG: amidohydrolase [Patulibacter sp.]|nr:amidohydrolase [Patulibacter sp.]